MAPIEATKKKEKEQDTKKKEDIYQKNVDESTLGVIDLNIIADTEHKWKTDNSGNYVVPPVMLETESIAHGMLFPRRFPHGKPLSERQHRRGES